jgi:hypothetical protein
MSTYSRLSTKSNRRVASQRITRTNLLTLRAAELNENKFRKVVSSLVNDVQALVGGMFAVQKGKNDSMCKYYGHVIPGKNWEGYLPKCGDCGAEISNPSQLRKASPQKV